MLYTVYLQNMPWRLHSIRYAPRIEGLRIRYADQLWRMLKLDRSGRGRRELLKLHPIDTLDQVVQPRLYGEMVTNT